VENAARMPSVQNHEQDTAVNSTAKHDRETDVDAGTITPLELVDMLDSGLSPVAIDRLCFTRWRMRDAIAERQSALRGRGSEPARATPAARRPVKSR